MNQGWPDQLEQAGLRIASIDAPWNSATIVFHCTAVTDVWVGGLVLSDSGQIIEAGGFGKALTYALIAAVTILGLVAVAIKISADLQATQEAKMELTEKLADMGYSATEINAILKGINLSGPGPFGIDIPWWAIGGIFLLAAILLLPGKK